MLEGSEAIPIAGGYTGATGCTGPWPGLAREERGMEELAGKPGNGPEEGVVMPEPCFSSLTAKDVGLSLFADPEKIH